MVFKKINDNKLIITFQSIEFPEFMNLDKLVSNTDEVKDIFMTLLDEAKEKVGFDAENFTINIDTKLTLNNDIIIEVTKLVKTNAKIPSHPPHGFSKKNSKEQSETKLKSKSQTPKLSTKAQKKITSSNQNATKGSSKTSKNSNHIKVKPKLVSKSHKSAYSVYKFNDFDDFLNFCALLKSSSRKINVKKVSNECLLYKYSDKYFLTLKDINENYSKIGLFYSGITEFAKFCLNSDSLFPLLCEYGTIIINNHALTTSIQAFC